MGRFGIGCLEAGAYVPASSSLQIPGRAICPKFGRTDERSVVNPNEQQLSDEPEQLVACVRVF
jgi:hypothetical protein